ncbi:MAG: alpha/beta hydrolase-fold protein [Acidobacteriota bacterium]|nr:alpha/beta hydrolase-fold protein [Acidobacteriota bacterium]
MNTGNLTLRYVFQEPREKSGEKSPLLLLLHGFGSNEQDLISFAAYLDKRFFIASARAPFTTDFGGFAWFQIRYGVGGMEIDAKQAEESRHLLLKSVGELVEEHDLDAKRVYLAGFSQGAIMIYSLILTAPEKFAGAVPMSGVLPPQYLDYRAPDERLKDFPIFVSHGVYDAVLPIKFGREAKAQLEKLPVKLDYKEYPNAHNVSEESLRDVVVWLSDKL